MRLALIQSKIYTFRNQKVILDFDLAELYGTETKRLKEAVRRNVERFEGEDFMFQLSGDEIAELSRTQIATLKKGRGFNIKYIFFLEIFNYLFFFFPSFLLKYPTLQAEQVYAAMCLHVAGMGKKLPIRDMRK
jgi:hypothetical protein